MTVIAFSGALSRSAPEKASPASSQLPLDPAREDVRGALLSVGVSALSGAVRQAPAPPSCKRSDKKNTAPFFGAVTIAV